MEGALARLDGDRDLLETIWKAFLKEATSKLDGIRKALEAGDAPVLERHAHSVKGAAASIGAMALKEAAFGMETAAKQGKMERVGADYPLFESELRKVEKCLLELLGKKA